MTEVIQMTCQHPKDCVLVIGEWTHYRQPGDKMQLPTMLVRECQDCGAVHLGNGPNWYERNWPGTWGNDGELWRLQDYGVMMSGLKCRFDGEPLRPGDLEHYDHPEGWRVKDFPGKPQWLYVTCRKCGYEWSLWKLGIQRPTPLLYREASK